MLPTYIFVGLFCFLTVLPVSSSLNSEKGFGTSKHVVIIGVDGLDLRCMRKANKNKIIPTYQSFKKNGVFTESCRVAQPSSSLPNWGTHLLGRWPSLSGITSNRWSWYPRSEFMKPQSGMKKAMTNVFKALKDANPNATTASFYSWIPLMNLMFPLDSLDKHSIDWQDNSTCAASIAVSQRLRNKAIEYIKEKKPTLTFLYLGEPDECAHIHTCFSKRGQESIATSDESISKVLEAISDAGIEKDTTIFVVSDHGRDPQGLHHGNVSEDEMTTIWMAKGPGIYENYDVSKYPITPENTSPTVLHALGISIPDEWHGAPILHIFKN